MVDSSVVLAQVKVHIGLLEATSNDNDDHRQEDAKRMVARVLHHLPTIRPSLKDAEVMAQLITAFPTVPQPIANLFGSGSSDPQIMPQGNPQGNPVSGQVTIAYLWLLTLLALHDGGHAETSAVAAAAIDALQTANNRAIDLILAKVYFYLYQVSPSRDLLMVGLRLAALRHDHETNAVIYNLILRSHVTAEQYDVALKFATQSHFPQTSSNVQLARYHYYLARIHAVHGDYQKASEHLSQALRKAPHGQNAAGFLQAACKLQVVTLLLSGELPERSLFKQPFLRLALSPYFALTLSVRLGDLSHFQAVLAEHQARFTSDHLYTLVLRLHHHVLKTGLRRLHSAYARVPLGGVAERLHLPSLEDAEYVVMKAIKDGVFPHGPAHLADGVMLGKPAAPAFFYATSEPQAVLHQRITQCQHLFSETVKAMRFPQGKKEQPPASVSPTPTTDLELLEEYMDELGDDTMDF